MSSASSAPASATGDSVLERSPWDELRIVSHANRHLDARRQILALSCRAASVDLTRGQTFSFARKQASPEVRALANQSPGLVRDLIRKGFAHSAQRATSLERARLAQEQAERLVAAFLAPPDKGVSTTKLVSERAALAAVGSHLIALARSKGYDLLTYDSGRLVVDLGVSTSTAKKRLSALRSQGLLRDVNSTRRGMPPRFKTARPAEAGAEVRSAYAWLADEILAGPDDSTASALWSAVSHPAISHGPLEHRGWICALLRSARITPESFGIGASTNRASLRAWDKTLGLPASAAPRDLLQRLDDIAQESGAQAKRDEAERRRRERAADRKARIAANREAKRAAWAARKVARDEAKAAARPVENSEAGVTEAPSVTPVERVTVTVPGLDPERHLDAVKSKVVAQKGPGWEVESVDAATGTVVFARLTGA